jgi:hypothetical protein
MVLRGGALMLDRDSSSWPSEQVGLVRLVGGLLSDLIFTSSLSLHDGIVIP